MTRIEPWISGTEIRCIATVPDDSHTWDATDKSILKGARTVGSTPARRWRERAATLKNHNSKAAGHWSMGIKKNTSSYISPL